jgi:signal transduction histidine kinase
MEKSDHTERNPGEGVAPDRVAGLEREIVRLRRSLDELSILNDLASAIGGLGSSQDILARIIRYSVVGAGAEQGEITLIDAQTEAGRKTAVRAVEVSGEHEPLHIHQSLLIWMDRNRMPLLVNNPESDARLGGLHLESSIRSLLCVPLIVKGAFIGVLTLYNKRDTAGFTPDDQRLCAIIGSQSAQVIENARLTELEHAATEERSRREREAQEQFARELIDSQERERQRIAAELHDSVGQNLLIIKNRAELALGGCEPGSPAAAELESIAEVSAQTIEEVREISFNLRPYQLDRLGLTKAIGSMVRRLKESFNIDIEPDVAPIDGLLPKDAEIALYRIVQEGMNNIVKHAGAARVMLRIERTDGAIVLRIQDNGRGFSPEPGPHSVADGQGFGLRSIAERVRLLGGTHSLKSIPGEGTLLSCIVPIPH